jgi:hypothetical protein
MENDNVLFDRIVVDNNSDVKLIKSIEKILLLNQLKETYANKLTKYSIIIIKRIMRTNPEFFLSIEEIVQRSIKTDRIDSGDIHIIISIITEFYNILVVMNKVLSNSNVDTQKNANLTCVMTGFLLKFFFRICIQENLIINDKNNDKILIKNFNNIISECIKLLELKEQKIIRLIGDNDDDEGDNSEYDVPVVDSKCCCFF